MPKIARGKASLLGAIPDPAPADTDQFMDSFSRTGKEALLESFKSLHHSGDYSGFTIKCGNDEYSVHKAIICPQSAFFAAMLKNDMKEKQTSEVDLFEDDPDAVRALIHYFYHQDYPKVSAGASNLGSHPSNKTNLLQHCKVYELAEMCEVDRLKSLAVFKFQEETKTNWNPPDFFEAIQEIYYTSLPNDRGMRDAATEVIYQHKDLLDNAEFQRVVKELDIAFGLLMVVKDRGGWP